MASSDSAAFGTVVCLRQSPVKKQLLNSPALSTTKKAMQITATAGRFHTEYTEMLRMRPQEFRVLLSSNYTSRWDSYNWLSFSIQQAMVVVVSFTGGNSNSTGRTLRIRKVKELELKAPVSHEHKKESMHLRHDH